MSTHSCLVASGRNYLGEGNVDKFDAIVYKIRYFRTDKLACDAIPNKRSQHQRYVLYTVEAPRLELTPRFVNSKCMSQ